MQAKTYKEYVSTANQDQIRQTLLYWMKRLPYRTVKELSEAVYIDYHVLRRFINGRRVNFNALAKIELWIEDQQRINKKG